RQQVLEKAREEAYEIVEEAREETERIIEELKAQKNYSLNEVAQLKHQLNELTPQQAEEEQDDKPFKVGDFVRITLTNQTGEIIALDKKNATVLCAGTKIKSSLSNLAHTSPPKQQKRTETRTHVQRSGSFKVECNLIGMRVEEAMGVLDKFLDDALLANAPFVRIIHGMGTGALRKAVWDRLKRYKFVKSYEMADGANGGSGATIVILQEKK
ncbi:MAG: Smr/MutS family protein, partial [Erysipelotrichaceae bacterium]|nr:Smr/MutS family protein [Erysipelotrichaceae bacterium]